MTLVLNGMPFIKKQLANYQKLNVDWKLYIVHGASQNVACTQWCQLIDPGLSTDGTTEWLKEIDDDRVKVLEKTIWPGKRAMCNAAIHEMREPGVLLQADADEIWTPEQIQTMCAIFQAQPYIGVMQFRCRYFLGPDILITSKEGYGCRGTEWLRAWRFKSGCQFYTHEPPILVPDAGRMMTRDETSELGLIFNHFAYATEDQALFKENFYGYKDARLQWLRLQANRKWPVEDISTFLPWVGKGVKADRINENDCT